MLIERSVNKLHCWYWVKNFVILESVICCCNVNYLAGATDSLSNCIASCLLMQCWKIMWNHHSAETKSIFTYISMMWLPWWWRGSEEARNAWFWGPQCTHRAPLAGGFPPQHPRGFTMYHPRRGKGPKVALLPCAIWYPVWTILLLNRLERLLYMVKWGKEDGIPVSRDKLR